MLSTLKSLSIDGIALKELYINNVLAWKEPASYKNYVQYSTESDGKTIYNGGLGYKSGYRVRSGGAEGTGSNASCTGYIPVTGGAVIRVSGVNFLNSTSSNAINVYDSGFNHLGQVVANYANAGYGIFAVDAIYQSYCFNTVVEEKTGVYKWVVPPVDSGIIYIRVTGNTANGEDLIVTVNEEITD